MAEDAEEAANEEFAEESEDDIEDLDIEDWDMENRDIEDSNIDDSEISADYDNASPEPEIQTDSEEFSSEDHSVSADGDEPELKELSLSWEGDELYKGMEQSPYLIQSLADLMEVHEYYNDIFCEEYEDLGYTREHFKLTTDIALTEAWKPMITSSGFCLDGNGHTISNIRIEADESGFEYKSPIRDRDNHYDPSSPREVACGLSFCAQAGTIKNLTIKNVKISCPEVQDASGVRNMQIYAYSCDTLDKCSIEGTVTIENDSDYSVTASGFCWDAVMITDCKMKADVTLSGIGIFSGFANRASNFVNCGVEGNITGDCSVRICGIGGYEFTHNQPDVGARNCYTAEGVTIHNTYQIANNSRGDAYGLFSSMQCHVINCVNNATVISDCGIAVGISYSINAASSAKKGLNITGLVNNGDIQGGGESASGICYNLSNIGKDSDYSVKNCANRGDITQTPKSWSYYGYASGLFYRCGSEASIADCINYGKVTGSNASGIASLFGGDTITRCANRGKLQTVTAKGQSYSSAVSGGIVGEVEYSGNTATKIRKIEECYNAGDISYNGNEFAGGILGSDKGDFYRTGSYAENTLVISNCYNVGKITSTKNDAVVGSIVGTNSGTPDNTQITGIHFLSGTASSAFGKGGNSAYKASKHSDADMKKASTYTGWDFDNIWTMGTEDYRYPVFKTEFGAAKTIILDANGGRIDGQGTAEVQTDLNGYLKSAPRPVKDEERFTGWYTEVAGGTRVTQNYKFIEDTTIYAHWEDYDDEKRMAITPIFPKNGEIGVEVKSDGWVNFTLSFSTESEITGFDLLSGAMHIYDYETGDSVYDLTSTRDISFKKSGDKSEISLKVYGIGMDYTTKYSVVVDEGFLIFENESLYAFTANNEWSFHTSEKLDRKRITILNEATGNGFDGELNYDFEYSDSFFYSPANIYNQKRTIWAMGLTMAGFESATGKSFDGYTDGAKNARKTLRQFGFTCYEGNGTAGSPSSANEDYKKKPGENTFGVFTAHKKITDYDGNQYTLIAVTTRGAGYEKEWVSNFQVGHGWYHEGFKTASDKVLKQLADYIEYAEISGELKIVMGGYSRAGATTNISAARIDDGELTSMLSERGVTVSIQRNNVYAYCFEPPASVCTTDDTETMYQNITNIINPSDIVPMIPLGGEGWNYKRYGTDYYLPNEVVNSENYSILKRRFLDRYASLGVTYDDSPFIYFLGATSDIKSWDFLKKPQIDVRIITTQMPLYGFLQKLTEDLKNTVPTSDLYLQRLQYDICNIVRNAFKGIDAGRIVTVLIRETFKQLYDVMIEEQLMTADSHLGNDILSAANNIGSYKFGKIFQEHEPFVNFAWLISINGESDLKRKNLAAVSVMQFNLEPGTAQLAGSSADTGEGDTVPAHMASGERRTGIEVYNSSNVLVAKIEDGVPVELPDSRIISYVDTNGQQTFMLPKDDSFRIEIVSADDGTMDFTASGYSVADMAYTDKTDYYDVALSKGATLKAEVSAEGSIVLKDPSQVTIDPSASYDENIPRHDIKAEVTGDGFVAGTGFEQVGNHVKLTAIPDPGAHFEGWYETEPSDEPLSTEQEYSFRVENDRTVYAKFSEVADEVFAVAIPDQTYTGNAIKPEVTLYDQKTKLVKGKDYTVSYKNNKVSYTKAEGEQGFSAKKAPCAIVKMKGNYSGTRKLYFRILPADISGSGFGAEEITVQYNGKKQTPAPVLLRNTKKLKLGTDFIIAEYYAAKNDKSAFKGAEDEDTVYELILTGKKNYTGTRKIKLTILGRTTEGEEGEVSQVLMSAVKVPSIPAQKYRSDEEGVIPITAENLLDKKGKALPFTVVYQKSKNEKVTLTENVDYSISYRNNRSVGTASIILTGLENKNSESGISLVGTKTVTFKITGTNLKKAKITGLASTYPYTGEEVIPTGYKVMLGNQELNYGDDYRATFKNNIKAGTATMTVTGTGPYTGSVKKTFKIGKVSLGANGAKSDSITVNEGNEITAVYKKSGTKPEIELTWSIGEEEPIALTEGVDFKVKYQNTGNLTASAPAKKMPSVKITGTGSFTGSFTMPVNITPADFLELSDRAFANDKVYSNKKGDYKSTVVITDADGKQLKAGTDYEVTEYALVGGIDPSTGNYVNLYPPTYLDQISKPDVGSKIRMTVKAKGNYVSENDARNTIYVDYRILAAGKDISKAKVTLKGSKPFNGSAVKLSADDFKSVKLGTEELVYGEDFEIDESSYVNHNKKGTAKVTIVGKGEYGGRQTVKFKIGTRSLSQMIWKLFSGLF
ncbi:MAG: InlB B-repeat-containing protein [Lachnospiraceae bacterium]|nr:InlB B-repeat-containing protein [Lachnospiraceae bacterium]